MTISGRRTQVIIDHLPSGESRGKWSIITLSMCTPGAGMPGNKLTPLMHSTLNQATVSGARQHVRGNLPAKALSADASDCGAGGMAMAHGAGYKNKLNDLYLYLCHHGPSW